VVQWDCSCPLCSIDVKPWTVLSQHSSGQPFPAPRPPPLGLPTLGTWPDRHYISKVPSSRSQSLVLSSQCHVSALCPISRSYLHVPSPNPVSMSHLHVPSPCPTHTFHPYVPFLCPIPLSYPCVPFLCPCPVSQLHVPALHPGLTSQPCRLISLSWSLQGEAEICVPARCAMSCCTMPCCSVPYCGCPGLEGHWLQAWMSFR